jgi:LPXTG-site transpeptidase (sortase) family protein
VAYVPFDGDTWLINGLREEVAWLGDTSWPGLGGNTALAAHVTVRGLGNGPFRYLIDLKQGDEIQLYTEENVYTYKVRERKEIDEIDLSITQPTDNSQVTLITCVEWNETIGIYLKRLAVTGDLVSTAPLPQTRGN